jgi:hypothetical protein
MAEDTPKPAEISEELRKRILLEERLKILSKPTFGPKTVWPVAVVIALFVGVWLLTS